MLKDYIKYQKRGKMKKIIVSLCSLFILASTTVRSGENTGNIDSSLTMRKMPGEIMPELKAPNLLKNSEFENGFESWSIVKTEKSKSSAETVDKDGRPALKINSGGGTVMLVSNAIDVVPGKIYILTGVYHSTEARFGTFAQIDIIKDQNEEKHLKLLKEPQIFGVFGGKEVYNRRPGEWQRYSKTFTPSKGEEKIRIAITQYGTPSIIYYGSFYFGEETPDTRKTEWKKYTYNLDPKLSPEEVAHQLEARPDSTAEIIMSDYPRIFIDENPHPSLIYFGDAFTATRSKMQDFQNAGVSLQILSLHLKLKLWHGNNDYDFKKMDEHLLDAISRSPQGNFIVRIDVNPYEEWKNEFPEHVAVDSLGKPSTGRAGNHGPPCYWSELYRKQVCDFLSAALKHMRTQQYFKAIVGFFICGNEDGQFYYQVYDDKTLQDGNSKGAIELFRKWLRGQYKSEDELQRVWNNKDAKFENVMPPIKMEKYQGCFFNPATNQAEIDFIRFLNESMGEFANLMCSTVKKEAGKKVISVMWWGRGASLAVYPHFAQTKVVFPSGDMDLMGAQPGYAGERENGNSCFIPWVFDSTRIHSKIPMIEADFRTWISQYKSLTHDYNVVRYWNICDLRGALLREFGKGISIAGGLWFYDMTAGWFKTPEIMDLIKKINSAAEFLSKKTNVFSQSEIVLVSDEQNYYRTTEQVNVWNGPNYHTIRGNQRALLRSGLKYDFYYLNDLINKKMTNYKVYVFLNLFDVPKDAKKFIDEKLKRDGKTIIWLYAPGYLTSQGFSTENMSALTGMNIYLDGMSSKRAKFLSSENPLIAGIANTNAGIGLDMYGERFVVADKDAVPLASYNLDGKTAAAVRKFNDWTSIYMGVPAGLTPQFLQNIASYAKVHIYNKVPGDMFFYHRDDLICLHGVEGNDNAISLPFNASVKDLLSGEILLDRGKSFSLKLQPGETKLLYLEAKN